MKCAIITCSEYKRKLFSPAFSLSYITLPFITEGILVINLPYTADKFFELTEKKRKKLAEKICRILYSENIFCIYMSGIVDCPEFSYIKYRFHYPDGKSLLKKYAATGACALASQLNIDMSDIKIALYQKNFNHTGFEILCDFAQHFKNITIVGNSFDNLDKYSTQLMDLYGLSVNLSDELSSVNSSDLLFLIDETNNICTFEKTIIADLTKTYPFHCLNSLKFEMPLSFNKLLPYFNTFDDICMEFLLYLIDSHSNSKEDISKIISNFGGKFKTFCAKSKNKA